MNEVLDTLRRLTPGPLLVRGTVFLAGFLALVIALPPGSFSGALGMFMCGLIALLAAVFPASPLVTAAQVITLLFWLLGTTIFSAPVTAYRVLALAATLYVLHTAAALAAALPTDAIVAPAVLTRWLIRTAVVLAVTVVAGFGLWLLGSAAAPRSWTIGILLGLVATLGLGVVLARLSRR